MRNLYEEMDVDDDDDVEEGGFFPLFGFSVDTASSILDTPYFEKEFVFCLVTNRLGCLLHVEPKRVVCATFPGQSFVVKPNGSKFPPNGSFVSQGWEDSVVVKRNI